MNQTPEIIYEDEAVIVCIKEAGIPTQTKRMGQQDMESLLRNYRAKKGEEPYIAVVHRLDQPVEGVMVFAKDKQAAAGLSRQIGQRMMDKYYLAVCTQGDLNPDETEVELVDYLLKDGKTNTSKVVPKGTREAKNARMSYRVLETRDGQALVEVKLQTGRHHQIRVQMANSGHPLLGDQKYGPKDEADAAQTGRVGAVRENVALCSYKIGFSHPKIKKKMDFTIRPTGDIFQKFDCLKEVK